MKKRMISFLCVISLLMTCMIPMQAVYAVAPTLPNLTQAQMSSAYQVIDNTYFNWGLKFTSAQPEKVFKVQVTSANPYVEIRLYGIKPGYNYDVALYNSNGVLITNKNSTNSLIATRETTNAGDLTSRIFRKVCSPGVYYVREFSRDYNYSTSNHYLTYSASSYGGISLNVPSIAQRQTEWCWLACAEMIGKWTVHMESSSLESTTKTQESIANSFGYNNTYGYSSWIVNCINHMTEGTIASSRGTAYRLGTFVPVEIVEQLYECRRALCILVRNNYYNSGHFMTVVGANFMNDTLYLHDPYVEPINGTVKPATFREVSRPDIIVNGDYANSYFPRYYSETVYRTEY